MREGDDLNKITIAGRVCDKPLKIIGNTNFIITFRLLVSKTIRMGEKKVSIFKVVLFDKVAARWENQIAEDMRLIVDGELDEVRRDAGDDRITREVRVVGRFLQVME